MLALAGGALPGALTNNVSPFAMKDAKAQSGAVSVLLNGRLLNLGATGASQVNGRVLVPLRGVFEALGASVDYDPATMTVFATRPGTQMQLRIGSNQANVNGQVRILDVPAQTRFGRTLVPLRFVSEALGAVVNWNDAQRTVYITADEIPSPIPGDTGLPPVNPPVNPPVTPPVAERERLSGVVVGAVVNPTAFILRTDDNDEITVHTGVAVPRSLGAYDRVTVSGTRNGDDFNAETLTIDSDVRPLRGQGQVTRINRRQITVEMDDGRTFVVIPNTNAPQVNVGDDVRINGYLDPAGDIVRYADVTIRNTNTSDTPPPATTGVNVDFTGIVESVDTVRRTFNVRGDNNQVYVVAYTRIGQITRNDRVRVRGTYADGLTTATTVTRVD